jgi:hypothetical protein
MAISITSTSVQIGSFSLTEGLEGITFDGNIEAYAFNSTASGTIGSPLYGTVSGYNSGGMPLINTIDKFPFASNANATDVGDLTQGRYGPAGQSSSVSGYTSGGADPSRQTTIDKFPFATNANATDVGDLTQARWFCGGQSAEFSGYTSGGRTFPFVNTIDRFPFGTDVNASDVGDLSSFVRAENTGQSSTVSGYNSGGEGPPGKLVIIDKFPFSTTANATNVGNLTQARDLSSGQSSSTHGYTSGGDAASPPPVTNRNTIDKFPFAADANATDVGDLTIARYGPAGQSSTVSGYTSGGYPSSPPFIINTIDKFPFATDANATDVGDLTQARAYPAGQQD